MVVVVVDVQIRVVDAQSEVVVMDLKDPVANYPWLKHESCEVEFVMVEALEISFLEVEKVFFHCAFGKHLEEKHMTWAQFGKKQDKNATLQDFDEALDLHYVETASQSPLTPSMIEGDDVTTISNDVKVEELD
ncbi:hypothetical protein Tco_0169140 [Tanacetum coccineum]